MERLMNWGIGLGWGAMCFAALMTIFDKDMASELMWWGAVVMGVGVLPAFMYFGLECWIDMRNVWRKHR
jgi:hypothetical protein